MPEVRKHPRAEADLIDIWLYIAEDSPENADGLLDRFDATFARLAEFPDMGRARPRLAPNLRSFSVSEYVIFYRPVQDGIEVVRVLHGRRRIIRDFF
jgi:toxin ParE1/3/4